MAVWSIVNFSDLKADIRLDAEYYQPLFLKFESLLTKTDFPIVNIGSLVREGYRVVYENTKILDEAFDPKYHVKFLQAANISSGFPVIEQSSMGWVSRDDWNRYIQGRLKPEEILIEVKGKAEKVAIVSDNILTEVLVTGTLYKMLIDENKINRYYVFVYLLSSFGRSFRNRGKTNTLISYVNKDDLYSIPIPVLPKKIQSQIAEDYQKAYLSYERSKELYADAEALLLHELGLNNLDLSTQKTYIANFSDTVEGDRFDAEYFQPKYYQLFDLLHSGANKKGWRVEKLGLLSRKLKYGTSANLEYIDQGIPFLRIADLERFRFNRNNIKYISIDAALFEKQSSVQKGDVLISRSGTLGLSIFIPKDLEGSIFGSYFIRTRPNNSELNSIYLSFYLNTLAGKMQFERCNTGAIQTNLTIPVIESTLIVVPPLEIQEEIAKQVLISFKTEDESKNLLEEAKHQVEQMIFGEEN